MRLKTLSRLETGSVWETNLNLSHHARSKRMSLYKYCMLTLKYIMLVNCHKRAFCITDNVSKGRFLKSESIYVTN